MRTLELATAKGSLSTYAREFREEAVCLTDRGKPVMVLLPVEGVDLETVSLTFNPRFLAIIERSRASCRPGEGIPTEEMRRRLAERRHTERKRRRAG